MSQSFLFDAELKVVPKLPGYPCAFSPCQKYRYVLYRLWHHVEKPRLVMFLMCNPSIADVDQLDPTLKRCAVYAKDWGFDGFCVCNLFAFRATYPEVMREAADPVGDENDVFLVKAAEHCETIVCGWGVNGTHQNRDAAVAALFRALGRDLYCLERTKEGHAKHPLYCAGDLQPQLFRKATPINDPHESEEV